MLPSEQTAEMKLEFIYLVTTYCNFVPSFDDERIPNNALYIFGHHKPVKKQQAIKNEMLQKKGFLMKKAINMLEKTTTGDWTQASSQTI